MFNMYEFWNGLNENGLRCLNIWSPADIAVWQGVLKEVTGVDFGVLKPMLFPISSLSWQTRR